MYCTVKTLQSTVYHKSLSLGVSVFAGVMWPKGLSSAICVCCVQDQSSSAASCET